MAYPIRRSAMAVVATFLLTALLSSRPAGAQVGPDGAGGTPEQQELAQQMREVGEQVMGNMLAQGINPRDFFEEVRAASPDGNVDMEVVRQKLLDKGLIDQQTVDHLEASIQKVGAGTLKQQLGVSDDEWRALVPKIQKVVDTAYASGAPSQQFAMLGFHPTHRGPSDATKALQDLRNTTRKPAGKSDTAAAADEIAAKLKAWRAARQQAREQYVAAQHELTEVLTRRQEAVLMLAGLLQ